MKVGMRKPNIKKSIKARTTGKVTRAVKKSVNPIYGKKGAGFVKDPAKSVKNSIYHKTTFGVGDVARGVSGSSSAAGSDVGSSFDTSAPAADRPKKKGGLLIGFGIFALLVGGGSVFGGNVGGLVGVLIGAVCLYFGIKKRNK